MIAIVGLLVAIYLKTLFWNLFVYVIYNKSIILI